MNQLFSSVFPTGEKNTAFGNYFVGQSYLNMLSTSGVAIGNVTFEPAAAITGTFTIRVDKFFLSPPAVVTIRNGESPRRSFILAMWYIFRQR